MAFKMLTLARERNPSMLMYTIMAFKMLTLASTPPSMCM